MELPHVIIRASAGTGKTFQLTSRYLRLLHAGVAPEQILATTFTRKAAREIQDRVFQRLSAAALDVHECRQLAVQLELPDLTVDRCLELIEQLTQRLNRLRICTLDGLFAQLATGFTLELGLPLGWQIIELHEDERLRQESIAGVLHANSTSDITRLTHLMAKGDVSRTVSEVIRDTVNRLYTLYCQTKEEHWHRFPDLPRLSDDRLDELLTAVATAAWPNDKRYLTARDKDLQAAHVDDWESFVSRGIPKQIVAGLTTFYAKEVPSPLLELYRPLVAHARAVLIQEVARQTSATYDLLHRFGEEYEQRKRQAAVLRFDDLTRILSTNHGWAQPEPQDFRLDSDLAHVLLDEFQDTSLPQWQVLRHLVRRVTERAGQQTFLWQGGQRSLFCVGDTKQAIYGWRGGKAAIFDALDAQLPEVEHRSLDESRRSSPVIIDVVNRVFTGLTRHDHLESSAEGVTAWCASYRPHSTVRQDLAGYAELRTAPRAAASQEQEDVTLEFAAKLIAEQSAKSPASSIAALVRDNRAVARLTYCLQAMHVPCSEVGGNPLTDSVAVQLILSALRLADHPGDTVARFHVVHSSLAEAIGLSRFDDDRLAHQVSRDIRRSLIDDGYGRTLERWAETLIPICGPREQTRLQQLVELAYAYSAGRVPLRTRPFIQMIEQRRVADTTTATVQIMTIHQAKGLEFDIVVLPNLDDGLIGQVPACVAGQSAPSEPIDRVCCYRNEPIQQLLPAELQELFDEHTRDKTCEALCLLYVALTRAVHALHMVIAPPAENEGHLPRSAAGLLRAALTDGGPLPEGTMVTQFGDPHWHQLLAAAPSTPPAEKPPHAIVLVPAPTEHERVADHMIPSEFPRSGASMEAAGLLQLDVARSTYRDRLVHHWLRHIGWLEEGVPTVETLRQQALAFPLTAQELQESSDQFFTWLSESAVIDVLTRQFYEQSEESPFAGYLVPGMPRSRWQLELRREQPFFVQQGSDFLSGKLDRLILLHIDGQVEALDIVEFTTETVTNAALPDRPVDSYRSQLDAYRQAVMAMFGLPESRVSARRCCLSRQETTCRIRG